MSFLFTHEWPIALYQSQTVKTHNIQTWICEWKSVGIASVPGGFFLVKAGHFLDAKHTAKKVLRDGIVKSSRFEFEVRMADAAEIKQLDAAPDGMILKMEIPPLPGAKDFVSGLPAHSTNKT